MIVTDVVVFAMLEIQKIVRRLPRSTRPKIVGSGCAKGTSPSKACLASAKALCILRLRGRTVGVIGTGQIGLCVARIMAGFGCEILAFDPHPDLELVKAGGQYVDLPELLARADVITLHCPLTPATYHLIDRAAIEQMKPGVMLINTSRGAVVDTRALIAGLKAGRIGHLGLDVYEEEGDLFFENLSDQMIQDDVFARLLTFPNVLITGHQAFFTEEAMTAIAETTIGNITSFERTGSADHTISVERLA